MLTLPEAARSLGLAPATLRLQIKLGRLRAVKLGRDWYIEAADVERYRREHLRRKDGGE